jgi:hypothetical protein
VVTWRCQLTNVLHQHVDVSKLETRLTHHDLGTHSAHERPRQLSASVSKNLAPIPCMPVNYNVDELVDSAKGGKNMGQASRAVLEKLNKQFHGKRQYKPTPLKF